MKNHKRYKTLLAVLCLLLISVSFTACHGKNDFYSGAKKYLKNKYNVKCDSLIYYEYPTDMSMGSSFGVIKLTNGDRVIVSLADGNYSDSYELLDLIDAWTDELSQELGADVVYIEVESDGYITFGNTAQENRTLGSFLETSKKRYNPSNLDEFVYDYYDFTYYEEIEVYIVEPNPTYEWMEELADKLEVYRNKVGAEKIEASVFESFPGLRLQLEPDDYYTSGYGFNYLMANGNGREYAIRINDWGSYHHYNTKKFKDNTIWITMVDFD